MRDTNLTAETITDDEIRILQADIDEDPYAAYAASMTYALAWARRAEAGDYLVRYEDTGMKPEQDPGSRCGYGDQELASIDLALRDRDLRLVADDRGLVAQVVCS